MTQTTHDLQVAAYVEEYDGPEITSQETTIDSEIALLMKELIERQRELAEARADLDRLTERNLAAVQAALSGK